MEQIERFGKAESVANIVVRKDKLYQSSDELPKSLIAIDFDPHWNVASGICASASIKSRKSRYSRISFAKTARTSDSMNGSRLFLTGGSRKEDGRTKKAKNAQ